MIDLPRFSAGGLASNAASERNARTSQNLAEDNRDDPKSIAESQSLQRAKEPLAARNEAGKLAAQEAQDADTSSTDNRGEKRERLNEILEDKNKSAGFQSERDIALSNERYREIIDLELETRQKLSQYTSGRDNVGDGLSASNIGSNRFDNGNRVEVEEFQNSFEDVSAATELTRDGQAQSAEQRKQFLGSKTQTLADFIDERQLQSREQNLSLNNQQSQIRSQGIESFEELNKADANNIVGTNVSVKA